jgi:hypothetical protein
MCRQRSQHAAQGVAQVMCYGRFYSQRKCAQFQMQDVAIGAVYAVFPPGRFPTARRQALVDFLVKELAGRRFKS